MLFVIIGWDAVDSKEKRPRVRPDHLAHWKAMDDAGRVILAGPMTDFSGSLFVVDAESQEAVEAHMATDPYVLQDVFQRVEVHPFKGVMPAKIYSA
ncbi:MAG: YciI family protein [Candidatus Sumerlaeota bacterium]